MVITYSVFQNGCLAGSRKKRNQLKIGAALQRCKCCLGELLPQDPGLRLCVAVPQRCSELLRGSRQAERAEQAGYSGR
jgi:hypothetical protein